MKKTEPPVKQPFEEKQKPLESYRAGIRDQVIVGHSSFHVGNKTVKPIYTFKGTAVTFDNWISGIRINPELVSGENKIKTSASKTGVFFEDLLILEGFFQTELERSVVFITCRTRIPRERTTTICLL